MKLGYIILTLIFSTHLHGQNKEGKDINFIILIDNKLQASSLTNLKIVTYSDDDSREVFEVDYYPGSLYISTSVLSEVSSSKTKKIYLSLDYDGSDNGKHYVNNYELEISQNWFNNRFTILKIDNLNRRKNKKTYKLKQKDHYIYSVDVPGQSIVNLNTN